MSQPKYNIGDTVYSVTTFIDDTGKRMYQEEQWIVAMVLYTPESGYQYQLRRMKVFDEAELGSESMWESASKSSGKANTDREIIDDAK